MISSEFASNMDEERRSTGDASRLSDLGSEILAAVQFDDVTGQDQSSAEEQSNG